MSEPAPPSTPPPPSPPPSTVDDIDPAAVLPLEAAREHLVHWWREPLAGVASLAIGAYDTWVFGRDDGLSSSLDEILIISGIVLIAGSKRLFGGLPFAGPSSARKPPSA
jgi:hypothetical protein